MKATKDKSKTKLDKLYETDEPVGGANCSQMIDREYDSDIVGGPIPTDLPPALTMRADQSAGSKVSLSVEAPEPTLTQPRDKLNMQPRSQTVESRSPIGHEFQHERPQVTEPTPSEALSDSESLHSAKSDCSLLSQTSMAEIIALRRELRGLRRDLSRQHSFASQWHSCQSRDQTDWETATTSCNDQDGHRKRVPAKEKSKTTAPHGSSRKIDGEPMTRCSHTVAAGGAPGGDEGDDGDSDWDEYRRMRDKHFSDAAKRRTDRVKQNHGADYPHSHTGSKGYGASQAASQQSNMHGTTMTKSGQHRGDVLPPSELNGAPQQLEGHVQSSESVMSAPVTAPVPAIPARIHIEQVRLPTFNGKDLPLFLKQFESIAEDSNWNELVKARKLMECLEGKTRRHVDETMDYCERIEALKQYYGGSRPSTEAKNLLRNFKKARDESIEEYASRIQAFADECCMTEYDKKLHMQMAFMNGLAYDTKMQRYIEKHTTVDELVPIGKLLKAAQQYVCNKMGSTSTGQRRGIYTAYSRNDMNFDRQPSGSVKTSRDAWFDDQGTAFDSALPTETYHANDAQGNVSCCGNLAD